MSQPIASVLLALVMIGMAIFLGISPPPGFESPAYRIALPFLFVAMGFHVLENLRTRTHIGQLIGAIRGLMARTGGGHTPEVRREAVEILLESLKAEAPNVRETAAAQLKHLTGQDFGTDAVQWHAWWHANKDTFK